MAKKNKVKKHSVDVTPATEEFWSGVDFKENVPNDFEKIFQDRAEYKYYMDKISKGFDPDIYDTYMEGLKGTPEERFKYADKFAKDNPSFYVPQESYADYIGEENVDRFMELSKRMEESYGKDTTGTDSSVFRRDAVGARSKALAVKNLFTKDTPDATRTYDFGYDPQKGGAYRSLVDLSTDPSSVGHQKMSEFSASYEPKTTKSDTQFAETGGALPELAEGVDTTAGLLAGASSGAELGSSLGPIGSVAGAVGGAIVGYSDAQGQQMDLDRTNEVQRYKDQMTEAQKNIQPTQNTQSEVYADGTAAANMTKPVEVERDELVFSKDALGNYSLKADFHGGKSHKQGGEDYQLQKGDVVFPGKKRSKILKAYKSGNTAALESERVKLPVDVPKGESKLKNGINNEDTITRKEHKDKWEKIISDNVASGEWTKKDAEKARKDLKAQIEDMESQGAFSDTRDAFDTYKDKRENDPLAFDFDPSLDISKGKTATSSLKREESKPKSTTKTGAKKEKLESDLINGKPFEVGAYSGASEMVRDVMSEGVALDPTKNSGPNFNTKVPDITANPNEGAVKKAEAETMVKGGSTIQDVLDYVPSAANILQGLQDPETVNRRTVTPEQMQYRDRSATARRDSDLQNKIDQKNASRFSGGSAQVARAGKAAAGAANTRRKSHIDVIENSRADQIEQANMQSRSAADITNIGLENQYDQMDAQNKAAIDAYFDQGVHDFSRISKQKSMDKKAEGVQDTMLKFMDSDNFGYTGDGIEYKG